MRKPAGSSGHWKGQLPSSIFAFRKFYAPKDWRPNFRLPVHPSREPSLASSSDQETDAKLKVSLPIKHIDGHLDWGSRIVRHVFSMPPFFGHSKKSQIQTNINCQPTRRSLGLTSPVQQFVEIPNKSTEAKKNLAGAPPLPP